MAGMLTPSPGLPRAVAVAVCLYLISMNLLVQATTTSGSSSFSRLGLLKEVFLSTAEQDFGGDDAAFDDAIAWHADRFRRSEGSGPHIACAEYGVGREAFNHLEEYLDATGAVRRLSNHIEHGTCFIATASSAQSAELSARPEAHGLRSFFPIPSMLKVAPGVLNHINGDEASRSSERLRTSLGKTMTLENVYGLGVSLSPGLLPKFDTQAEKYTRGLLADLMSSSLDLYATNFWSHPDMLDGHAARPGGALRAREWTRAADVIHNLGAGERGPTPGDICSWSGIHVNHFSDDHLVVTGLDHLLSGGRGAGGKKGAESEELKAACFMSLVSCLASAPEVLRVTPLHKEKMMNAVASSIVQAGSIDVSDKPLTAAGLDGSGEVIQVVDSGVDETSCFFIDEDEDLVERGYYFDEFFLSSYSSSTVALFNDGNYPFDLTRRKIVQYIRLVREDSPTQSPSFSTAYGNVFPWMDPYGFGVDTPDGHGTHTAGSAAGASLTTPAKSETCSGTDRLGCLGECLNTTYVDALLNGGNWLGDFATLCPQFDCDGNGDHIACLDEDVATTLTENGGIAQGAQLAIFDVSIDGLSIFADSANTGLWAATDGTGCMLHSNSWGSDTKCVMDASSVLYDQYMYENPDHLLLFAAGNEGDLKYDPSRNGICTIGSPALSKNSLAVGASSSGATRLTTTKASGNPLYSSSTSSSSEAADIDVVAYFSSYGLTSDYRIKPDVVAPGDQVLSSSSDGESAGTYSCQLVEMSGTSMSTPIVAGSSAMVLANVVVVGGSNQTLRQVAIARQYFRDETFYVADLTARGLCDASSTFTCEAFSPYAATIKAMLINSADLMGGAAEPDGLRGFGRVHLETVLPLGGSGDSVLFVADAASTSIGGNSVQDYTARLTAGTGLDLRVTLAWIDPAGSVESTTQLVHDLDLMVVSPGGSEYQMWSTGKDAYNVVERVIVPADDIDGDNSDSWVIRVSSGSLTTSDQAYSLVVTGPIALSSLNVTTTSGSARAIGSPGGLASILTTIAAFTATLVAAFWAA